ncbi:putative defensin-like protein [Cardamine amara subsp. amara]|uniref:Defensin-like protein n=1 Tax=Cardamine amara subsp. amara TaxID=228776 RepID=A0ABD1BC00_CARAN
MNSRIAFMSFVVIISVIILFLMISDKVDGRTQCIGLCYMMDDCTAACIKSGFGAGKCVGWENPDMCCCDLPDK